MIHLGQTESMIFGPKRNLQNLSLEDFKISCKSINIEAKCSVMIINCKRTSKEFHLLTAWYINLNCFSNHQLQWK
jgi:hypothetical protein